MNPDPDTAAVCARLGIDGETCCELRRMLADEIDDGVRAIRHALRHADVRAARSRLRELKGAGANLGATRIVSRIARLEARLSPDSPHEAGHETVQDRAPARSEASLPARDDAIRRALDDLETEGQRLVQPADFTPR